MKEFINKVLPDNLRRFAIGITQVYAKDYHVMISAITDAQEKQLSEQGHIFVHGEKVNYGNVYCFGPIDFFNDEDLAVINKIKIEYGMKGALIPAHYDCETHTCPVAKDDSNIPYRVYETFNVENVFRFAYNSIGSPDKIIIYRVCKTNLMPLHRVEQSA